MLQAQQCMCQSGRYSLNSVSMDVASRQNVWMLFSAADMLNTLVRVWKCVCYIYLYKQFGCRKKVLLFQRSVTGDLNPKHSYTHSALIGVDWSQRLSGGAPCREVKESSACERVNTGRENLLQRQWRNSHRPVEGQVRQVQVSPGQKLAAWLHRARLLAWWECFIFFSLQHIHAACSMLML